MAVRVVTDSSSDLSPELSEEFGIEIVPLTIRFGDEEFVDGKELTTEAFWTKLQSSDVLPETAAPSVGAFESTFTRLADDGADGIICLNLSSKLSATMQSAQLAAKALDGVTPIEIVDTQTVSGAIGMLALHAAQRAEDGADLETITSEVISMSERTHLYAALDTLEFLKRGGRIGAAQALVGSLLSIKPVIEIAGGVVAEAGKVRTRSKSFKFLVDAVAASPVERIGVMHAQADDVDVLIDELAKTIDVEPMIGLIGPVVGVHAGPGTVGIAWIDSA